MASNGPKIVKFVATVSTRGKDELVINIPRKYHPQAKYLQGKDVKVIIEEIMI